ncbi:MAG: ATP-binding protein [Chloroflexota bacterium]|nr:ATP-binding protein [Chloroflexota bacterium]
MTTFRTRNNSPNFWAGYARQTVDFQAALGELIDNALSATLPKPAGRGRQTAVIELTVQEREDGLIRVQVADAGTGVRWEDLTGEDNIFNLGFVPSERGKMNEHGFGLKNALALMTSGF